MSVIVKGMEMPKQCGGCPLRGNCKQRIYIEYRPKDCPMVELPPHGRLIDIKSVKDGKFVTVDNDYQRWWNGALESVIDNAPTVIEGSET